MQADTHQRPSMHLSALILSFSDRPDAQAIKLALNAAFSLGHEFGIERAADVVDQCNREGYNAIGVAKRIRALLVIDDPPGERRRPVQGKASAPSAQDPARKGK